MRVSPKKVSKKVFWRFVSRVTDPRSVHGCHRPRLSARPKRPRRCSPCQVRPSCRARLRSNDATVGRETRTFVKFIAGKDALLTGLQVHDSNAIATVGTRHIADLGPLRINSRTDRIVAVKSHALRRAACQRLSVNLRTAASVAGKVQVLSVGRKYGFGVNGQTLGKRCTPEPSVLIMKICV